MNLINRSIIIFTVIVLFIIMISSKQSNKPTPYQFPDLKYFPPMPATQNVPTVEGIDLGRHLFYDPILSLSKSISCAGCHSQEAAFSDAPKRYSVGISGELMQRNTMPLFNLAWYPFLHWDGKALSIEDQVFLPVRAHNEMNLDWKVAEQRIKQNEFYRLKFQAAFGSTEIDSILIAKAIAQFERILISNNSKYDKVLRGEALFTKEEYDGFVLINEMTKGDCLHCHVTEANSLGTTAKFSNNGLDSIYNPDDYKDKGRGGITGREKDIALFRIPSLRNVAVTAPYMHDGRFNTLREVLDFYSDGVNNCYNIDSKMEFAHRGGVRLTEDEKDKIIAFLFTMTDSLFLTNPDFSNPFTQ